MFHCWNCFSLPSFIFVASKPFSKPYTTTVNGEWFEKWWGNKQRTAQLSSFVEGFANWVAFAWHAKKFKFILIFKDCRSCCICLDFIQYFFTHKPFLFDFKIQIRYHFTLIWTHMWMRNFWFFPLYREQIYRCNYLHFSFQKHIWKKVLCNSKDWDIFAPFNQTKWMFVCFKCSTWKYW